MSLDVINKENSKRTLKLTHNVRIVQSKRKVCKIIKMVKKILSMKDCYKNKLNH